ncbi:class I SAM-dependent methyltransferase [Bacillus sp. CRN 9]|uniref:class I SAM-dependent methyltransferase n=1 Tax=Cytobacillus horneckiae TaxID=549687 RepID=UPI001561F3BF|nr:methyltransferase domain-containing protein [Bacillus sp. CRN 9]
MGNEFIELFEEWAKTYDDTVTGHDEEYKDVFLYYDKLLQEVADRAEGNVLEFGPGTGNLTAKVVARGLSVTGVEPSKSMREIAVVKLEGRANIINGDFMHFIVDEQIDTIISSYAFHHLTDKEKAEAIELYGKLLPAGGKIVFADTMYENVEAYKKAIADATEKGYHNLAEDLQREYYTTIPILREMMVNNGFSVSFNRCNDFVWIMEGVKA